MTSRQKDFRRDVGGERELGPGFANGIGRGAPAKPMPRGAWQAPHFVGTEVASLAGGVSASAMVRDTVP
ncbi:MAG: hypothetical protein IPM54_43980 [Polyangiaceae bacterium]|nr:hypothetical protein [Polyangiaceae bacterium]